MSKTPDRTRSIEDILDLQRLQKKRGGLNPGLLKKSESIIDAIYIRDADVDIDALEKQHQILSDYFFISAKRYGYAWRKEAFRENQYNSIMVLPLEAKLKRQIELLKMENQQLRRKINGNPKR